MKKIISTIYTLLVIVFVFVSGKKLLQSLNNFTIPLDQLSIIVFIQLLSILCIPIAWYFLIKQFSKKPIKITDVYGIYGQSWLGRYIPGKVGWVVGRVVYGKKLGISKKMLTFTSIFEIIITLLILGLFSLPAFFILSNEIYSLFNFSHLVLIVIVFLISIFIFILLNNKHKFIQNLIKNFKIWKNRTGQLSYKNIFFATFFIFLASLVSFIPFLILFSNFSTINLLPNYYLFSLFYLSSLLGIVAFFAPVGIGVREFVLFTGFTLYNVNIGITAILIYFRLANFISDILFYFLGLFLLSKKQKLNNS